jgi:hypothetical protein
MKNFINQRLIIFLISLLVLYSCKSSIPCIPPALQGDVLAFYPFTNGSFNDQSGNNQNLQNQNYSMFTSDRGNNPKCAWHFNNYLAVLVNDPSQLQHLYINNPSFLNGLTDFSISLWYQPENNNRPTGLYETLVGRGDVGACPNRSGQWSVGLYDCRKAVYGRLNSVWDLHMVSNLDCQQEIDIRTGTWHHLVATYNYNSTAMKIYRDGILQNTVTGLANCTGVPTIQDIGDLYIGRKYTGKIDDIILFKKTLTPADVDDLYQMPPCCESLKPHCCLFK